jgi:hypothetical protein
MGRFCFTFACDLKEDTPQQVIDTLTYMTRTEDYEFNNPPEGAFFEGDSWRTCLFCENEWFSFPGEAGRFLRSAYRYNRSFNEGGAAVYLYTLSFRCESKDDGLIEYIDIVEWLAPYSATRGFVGYWIYEYSQTPTLIYILNGHTQYSDALSPT